MRDLHIDIETYSSIDIANAGAYKYLESIDFEILMVAFAFDDNPVRIVDLSQGEQLPEIFLKSLTNPNVRKHAHNAVFERMAFKNFGIDVPTEQWHCSAIKSAYCGYPLSLAGVSAAMGLGDKGKDSAGKALIKYFSCPVKPTKVNGKRRRNLPHHNPEKWEQFKEYCKQDVVAEREILKRLELHHIPDSERTIYLLDQKINDTGILVDLHMANKAVELDKINSSEIVADMRQITGLENPNSVAQLKAWLSEKMGKEIKSLNKDVIPELIEEAGGGAVEDILNLRAKAAKSSVKKYTKMLECTCEDNRAHGLFQFYGASRTGRWAGRLVQLQNLPQNHLEELEAARGLIRAGDYDTATMVHEDLGSVLSQLIRTTFIAKPGHTFAVADFSAIEARVIAWLAGEDWRLDVFNSHGKIYEASAAMMFDVPIEEVTKGSDYRAKGKVAELALGYQGALGALKAMGGEKMGLSDMEMENIVTRWRLKSPAIVGLWKSVENSAKRAVRTKTQIKDKHRGLVFAMEGTALTIKLPSGRKLFYQEPSFTLNKFGQESLQYKGMVQATHKWGNIDTYGGKLTENIVQAIARDLLAESMIRLDKAGYSIVMHVHDEAICEIEDFNLHPDPIVQEVGNEHTLDNICEIMGEPVGWAPGLPLVADGYITPFYKKD